jgi:O-antigen ligase
MTLFHRSQVPALALSAVLAAGTALAVTGGHIPATNTGVPLRLVIGLALLAFLVIALWAGPLPVLLVWLAFAPFQNTLGTGQSGHLFRQAFFSAPPLIFVLWLLLQRRKVRGSLVDALPALYLCYVLASALLTGTLVAVTQTGLSGSSVGLTQIYSIICIGVVSYYFLAFVDLDESLERRIAAVLLYTGSLIAVLAVVGKVAGLTGKVAGFDFGSSSVNSSGVVEQGRVAGPLGDAGVLGTFLGVVLVVAVAILVWEGPRELRKLSAFTVVVVPPALFLSLTRAPLLAAAVACILVVAVRSRSRWPGIVALSMAAMLLVVVWGVLASTSLYKNRFANASNVQGRAVLDKLSLELAARKPVVGWGYGTFDHVKNTVHVNLGSSPLPPSFVFDYTSHNTFLTVLVELGGLGLALLLAPWLVTAAHAIRHARAPSPDRWVVIAALGIIGVWIIDAGTADMRFFPFASTLPWLAAGLLRRQALREQSTDGRTTAARPKSERGLTSLPE